MTLRLIMSKVRQPIEHLKFYVTKSEKDVTKRSGIFRMKG